MSGDHYRCPVPAGGGVRAGDGGRLGAMLRAGACGMHADEAAVELLVAHRHWTGHGEVGRRFAQGDARPDPGGGPGACIDWPAGARRPGRGGVAGVALLRPEEQVFDAMLAGWASQQLARNLGFGTIENRQRAVRAFAAHAGCLPWQWSAQLVDEWCTDLRAVRHLARSTVRNYTESVRLLCGYLTDPAYDGPAELQSRFGTHPVQVCHEWNTAVHAQPNESGPSKRAFTLG